MNAQAQAQWSIRSMRSDDIPGVTSIFNETVEAGETTYDVCPRTPEQVSIWLMGDAPQYKAFVCDGRTGILGWAAITRYHERAAYSPTVELQVYVAKSAQRAGIGRQLMQLVVAEAKQLGFRSAVLILFPESGHVIEMAKSFGFSELGRLQGVYPFKENWRDIVLMQLSFQREGETGYDSQDL